LIAAGVGPDAVGPGRPVPKTIRLSGEPSAEISQPVGRRD